MAHIECTFLIPERRDADLSDGCVHYQDAWDWLDDELFEKFDGRTIAPGLYEGIWRDPSTNQRVSDMSRKFIVAVPNDRIDFLRDLMKTCARVFQQKAIYLNVGGAVEFVIGTDT